MWDYSFSFFFFLFHIIISASLASLTRETGPKVVRGDPTRQPETPRLASHDHVSPTISVSDSSLKFTHVLYNLSPAGNDNF